MNISTHSLTGRLTCCMRSFPLSSRISTHSLTGRLTRYALDLACCDLISTHSLTGRLTIYGLLSDFLKTYFNSQPHREADELGNREPPCDGHFNSQPHREADKASLHVLPVVADISTHSLTGRLTECGVCRCWRCTISTHSLTGRLTAILNKNHFI